jgi:hypothetical protein
VDVCLQRRQFTDSLRHQRHPRLTRLLFSQYDNIQTKDLERLAISCASEWIDLKNEECPCGVA